MLASVVNASPATTLKWTPISTSADRLFLGRRSAHVVPFLRSHSRPISSLTFARRRNPNPTAFTPPPKSNKKRLGDSEELDEFEDIDDDALEALFNQLEEDLKNGDLDDEELTAEDLEKLNKEMADLDEELSQVFDMTGFESEDDFEDEGSDDDEEETDDEDDEDEPLQLRNWQLRRLAFALKTGRRKTNIKSLAAELGIDRSIVLEVLRNPPPDLLMLSVALPDDEPSSPIITIDEPKTVETEVETAPQPNKRPKPDVAGNVPVHILHERYSSQKRLKKFQISTLEDVYSRTKRPTNSMIQSIVDVTNLPRKRVVKWFEDKRAEEGVPKERIPYQRNEPDTAQ